MAGKRKNNISIETKIQKWILKDKLAYIELLIYRSICSGPLDFDISEFDCICFKATWKLLNRFHSKAILQQHVKYVSNLMKICY